MNEKPSVGTSGRWRSYGRRGVAALCNLWLAVGLALGLFLLLETATRLTPWWRNRGRVPPDSPQVEHWGRELMEEELAASELRWEPYAYWRRRPFQGNLVNIDDKGVRATRNRFTAGLETTGRRLKIFMFGGSTMWGSGSSDADTIPSLVARELGEFASLPIDVTNFGESGYVNTQELICLFRLLQKGDIPDVVVFFDGFNDVGSAFQNAAVGVPANERNRQAEFNFVNKPKASETFQLLLRTSAIHQVFRELAPKNLDEDKERFQYFVQHGMHELARAYIRNLECIQSLGLRFGFESLFYWQPTVFWKEPLTGYEREVVKRNQVHAKLQLDADTLIASSLELSTNRSFRDITKIFQGNGEQVFLDMCHMGMSGNRVIARRIAEDLVPLARVKLSR